MKTLSLKTYSQRRGAKSELARRFNLTAGAITSMLTKDRDIFILFEKGQPKYLDERKRLAVAVDPVIGSSCSS